MKGEILLEIPDRDIPLAVYESGKIYSSMIIKH